jgi:3-oxoacyl-[acyl-carrier protein] reductase
VSTLDGRVALVTGGSRSIGREVALELARQGADLVICGRRAETLEPVAAEIEALGRRALAVACDVAVPEQVEALAGQALEALEHVDIVVNNAGVTQDAILFRLGTDAWRQVIDTNLTGTYLVTRAFARPMARRRWGRIINVSSVVGVMGNAGQANYAASKAGIIGFTKSVARELASRSVTANVVAPGYVETDMTAGLSDEVQARMLASIPAGRLGVTTDVAPVVAFLATDQAGYVNGQVIHVDGGMLM